MTRCMLVLVALLGCHPPRDPAFASAAMVKQDAVDGIAVTATTRDWITWTLDARNDTDDALSLVWDESSFVDGAGRSWGRLIPGSTRRMDISAPHPAMPLAPHAAATAVVIPELPLHGGVDPYAMTTAQMTGSRMLVVVQTPSGKRTWQATLTPATR